MGLSGCLLHAGERITVNGHHGTSHSGFYLLLPGALVVGVVVLLSTFRTCCDDGRSALDAHSSRSDGVPIVHQLSFLAALDVQDGGKGTVVLITFDIF
jgi:hypothetical protein